MLWKLIIAAVIMGGMTPNEQGFGDCFQFSRYLKPLRERGNFIFFPPPELRHVFRDVPELCPDAANVNYRCYLGSLPRLLRIYDPAESPMPPYLFADAARVDALCGQLPAGFKVAIAWQGQKRNPSDAQRSFKAVDMKPLLSCGASFISLQKNYGSEQLSDFPGAIELPSLDADAAFVDTAAVLANVNLLVTCDTALAHLAGAMNVPVWVALAKFSDWRWGVNGDTTPWYPSMRLFRQETAGDWGSVFHRMRSALNSLVT